MAREVKSLTVQLKADASGEFEVRFASKRDAAGNLIVDHDGDVYADNAIGEQSIHIGCWNHGECSGPAGTGKTFETRQDIRAKGALLMATQAGREEFERWKALGAAAEFSYQYRVKAHDFVQVNGRRVRQLKALEVISVDLVARGAGIGTGVVSLKSADCGCNDEDWRADVAREMLHFEVERAKRTLAEHAKADKERLRVLVEESKRLLNPHPEVDEGEVCPQVVAAAKGACAEAAEAGGLVTSPALRWFKKGPAGDRSLLGKALPWNNEIWLRYDLSPKAARWVTAHEVGHFTNDGKGNEEQANRFAEQVTGRRWNEVAS